MKHVKEIEKGKVYLIDFRDSEGKRWRKKIHGTKKYAEEVATRLMKEKEDDVFFPERRTLKVTYGQLADAYWQLHGKELPGRSAYSMWKMLKNTLGNVKMKYLTSAKLQQFYNELADTHKSSTCNRYFAVLGAVIEFGIKHDLWNGKNPCIVVAKKPEDNNRESYWGNDKLTQLFQYCKNKQAQQIVRFALHSGMRRREIFDLDWSNVDMELGVIYILQSKTRKKRIVPMSNNLQAVLSEIGAKKSGRVFTMKVSTFESAFKRAKAKAGLKGLTFHDLRHTFATTFRVHNGSMSNLQGILGHTTPRMTNRYAHFSPEYLKEVIACMNTPQGKA
ncbi:MAG: site-specific integrase [Elusimicrobiaceae bacterium]|nr:site-specific integrase [Elusimicrobiaceae bacterium]